MTRVDLLETVVLPLSAMTFVSFPPSTHETATVELDLIRRDPGFDCDRPNSALVGTKGGRDERVDFYFGWKACCRRLLFAFRLVYREKLKRKKERAKVK
jgi:hypothetical protein